MTDRDCTCTYRGLGGNDPDGYVQLDGVLDDVWQHFTGAV